MGAIFILACMRAFGMLLVLPLGREIRGVTGRLLFALGLGFVVALERSSAAEVASIAECILGLLLGALLALPTALLVAFARMGAELFDAARGQHMAELIDPLYADNISALALFARTAMWNFILLAGGLELLVAAYLQSFEIVPLNARAELSSSKIAEQVLLIVAHQFAEVMGRFLPLATLFLGVEIFLGFLSRLLPRISFVTESFTLKTVLGFLVLFIWATLAETFGVASHPLDLIRSVAYG